MKAIHPHGGYAHFGCKCRGCRPPKPLPDHAGIVAYRRARSTGTHVGLYKSAEAGIESDPDYPWSTVCEEHAGVVAHHTRREAESYLSHPEDWCPVCQGHEPAPDEPCDTSIKA
jgi:hypothetical protein